LRLLPPGVVSLTDNSPCGDANIFQHTCGADFHPLTICAACREPLHDGELTVTGGTHPVQAVM